MVHQPSTRSGVLQWSSIVLPQVSAGAGEGQYPVRLSRWDNLVVYLHLKCLCIFFLHPILEVTSYGSSWAFEDFCVWIGLFLVFPILSWGLSVSIPTICSSAFQLSISSHSYKCIVRVHTFLRTYLHCNLSGVLGGSKFGCLFWSRQIWRCLKFSTSLQSRVNISHNGDKAMPSLPAVYLSLYLILLV